MPTTFYLRMYPQFDTAAIHAMLLTITLLLTVATRVAKHRRASFVCQHGGPRAGSQRQRLSRYPSGFG
jgi:hypothetical protein